MSKYSEQLLDPRWQKKRIKILERDDFACLSCGSKEKTLHVHHCYYVKNRKPWHYPNYSLVTLCVDCHREEGKERELGDLESGYSEFENTLDILLKGKSQFCSSPALSEVACVASALQDQFGVFCVEGAMLEGLLRLWKKNRTDDPPIWIGNDKVTMPWVTQWVLENFQKPNKNE